MVIEGIFLGYSQNYAAHRVLNKWNQRIQETSNLTLNDYHVKKFEHEFPQKSILSGSNEDSKQMLTFDVDFDLVFGIPNKAIDVEVNIEDNYVLE